jgi:hypothetical protein
VKIEGRKELAPLMSCLLCGVIVFLQQTKLPSPSIRQPDNDTTQSLLGGDGRAGCFEGESLQLQINLPVLEALLVEME